MKMISKVLLTAAAIAALATPALAADKLIVKDAAGTTTVFKVDDTGMTTATKIGVGTTSPLTPLHVADTSAAALRGFMATQHNDTSAAASIMFRKSRGTEAVPAALIAGDYIGLFQAQFWDTATSSYLRAAQFGFRNDGATVSSGSFPTAIMFYTGDKGTTLKEGLRITYGASANGGDTVVGNLAGSGTADMPTSTTSGFLYIPTVAGALTTCGTVPTARTLTVGAQYPGHVPVWYDTTNNKICTCAGVTLKCTAVLN